MTTIAAANTMEPEETAPDTRLIRKITLRNLLSFGPDMEPLALGPLNVLIGPNGSGKSNLIESSDLLHATSGDFGRVLRGGGGVTEWVFKGAPDQPASVQAQIAQPWSAQPLRHTVRFTHAGWEYRFTDEAVEEGQSSSEDVLWSVYEWRDGEPEARLRDGGVRKLKPSTIHPDASILAQLRDPEEYPHLTYLGDTYEQIRIYREWPFGRNTVFREPQRADMRNH